LLRYDHEREKNMGFLIGILLFSLVIFAIPFIIVKSKETLLAYTWISIGFLLFVWGQDYYWTYTHPSKYPGMFAVIGYMIGASITGAVVFSLLIVIIKDKLSAYSFKWFLVPSVTLLLIFYLLMQGFLIYSAHKAYDKAVEMNATEIMQKSAWDFYSPFIRRITIEAGVPKRYYRWSYSRSRYVFELHQYQNLISEKVETESDVSFYWFPYELYTKDYHMSIPKDYYVENKYNQIQFTIPHGYGLSKFFDFSEQVIRVSRSNYVQRSSDKKLEDKYGLKTGMSQEYFNGEKREAFVFYNEKTLYIACPLTENNQTTNICQMTMLNGGFKYAFDIPRKNVSQYAEIGSGVSKLFISFIIEIKDYPKNLNPYK